MRFKTTRGFKRRVLKYVVTVSQLTRSLKPRGAVKTVTVSRQWHSNAVYGDTTAARVVSAFKRVLSLCHSIYNYTYVVSYICITCVYLRIFIGSAVTVCHCDKHGEMLMKSMRYSAAHLSQWILGCDRPIFGANCPNFKGGAL